MVTRPKSTLVNVAFRVLAREHPGIERTMDDRWRKLKNLVNIHNSYTKKSFKHTPCAE